MNLQHERIAQMCETLKLPFVVQGYGAAAQQAAKDEIAYSDFLEGLLREEMAGRTVRKQSMMTRLRASRRSRRWSNSTMTSPRASSAARSRNWPDWASSSAMRTWCWSGPAIT